METPSQFNILERNMIADFLNWTKRYINSIILSLVCFLTFVVFEAFQQMFYTENFNNGVAVDLNFWEVLTGGLYRWMVWFAVAIPLVIGILRYSSGIFNTRKFLVHTGFVALALFLNLLIITLLNASARASWIVFAEVFEFYFFHKAPVIFIALVFLILLVHYFKGLEALELQTSQVGQLKRTNQELFEELEKGQLSEESLVLEIKTGNRVKLLPEDKVLWIEADDYCVRIHDLDGKTHTLRSSLKAFEKKLPTKKFLRIHRKAIVNLNSIKEYKLGDVSLVVLSNGQEVPIAQSRVKELKNSLQLA